MKPHTLNKPPIKEAVFEVLLTYKPDITIDYLEGFSELVKTDFTDKKDILQFEGKFDLPSSQDNSFKQKKFGYIYSDKTNNTVIQTRLNGFSFCQLNKTYTEWSVFKEIAFKYLSLFFDYIHPVAITRISLRYINQIDLPLPINNLQDYFKTFPISGSNFGDLSNYFMQLHLVNDKYKSRAVLNEILSPVNTSSNIVSVILDIDVLKEKKLPFDFKILSTEFNSLRKYKNEIFFNSITNKTEELFS